MGHKNYTPFPASRVISALHFGLAVIGSAVVLRIKGANTNSTRTLDVSPAPQKACPVVVSSEFVRDERVRLGDENGVTTAVGHGRNLRIKRQPPPTPLRRETVEGVSLKIHNVRMYNGRGLAACFRDEKQKNLDFSARLKIFSRTLSQGFHPTTTPARPTTKHT